MRPPQSQGEFPLFAVGLLVAFALLLFISLSFCYHFWFVGVSTLLLCIFLSVFSVCLYLSICVYDCPSNDRNTTSLSLSFSLLRQKYNTSLHLSPSYDRNIINFSIFLPHTTEIQEISPYLSPSYDRITTNISPSSSPMRQKYNKSLSIFLPHSTEISLYLSSSCNINTTNLSILLPHSTEISLYFLPHTTEIQQISLHLPPSKDRNIINFYKRRKIAAQDLSPGFLLVRLHA